MNNNKKKNDYIYVTLLVNNAPKKFILDSGSPVTLLPQRLFNEITKVEKMNNDYKYVIDNKIEFIGQTNATVQTNTTTLQLPLLILKANITPLMGLDWMKRLKKNNQLKYQSYQKTQHKNGRKRKENPEIEERIQRFVLQQHRNKGHRSQDKSKRKCKHNTTKKKSNTNRITRPSSRRIEEIDKERISGKSNRN